MESTFQALTQLAKKKSLQLTPSSLDFRNSVLHSIVKNIAKNKQDILSANQKDQELAKKQLAEKKIQQALFDRLKLDESKFQELLKYPPTVAKLADPLKKVQYHCILDNGLNLKRYSVPLGLLLVIFESRPEVLVQISSLAIKSGNAVLLKGGSEVQHTNKILFKIINSTLAEYQLQGLIHLLKTRAEVKKLLQEKNIDLIIPRGSNQLVQYIKENTKIPVMGHADGICHTFIDKAANKKKAINIVIDGKCDYPAVCNATETLLLHKELDNHFIIALLQKLQEQKVELRLTENLATLAKKHTIQHKIASEQDWKTEYMDNILSIKEVGSSNEAIAHINHYSSHHTDTIVTEDKEVAQNFLWQVDSAGVFHNASTRFADGYAYGLGAEVGVSTSKLHARGPVGLEGLMGYKYILEGQGQIKASYAGKNAKKFLHKILH